MQIWSNLEHKRYPASGDRLAFGVIDGLFFYATDDKCIYIVDNDGDCSKFVVSTMALNPVKHELMIRFGADNNGFIILETLGDTPSTRFLNYGDKTWSVDYDDNYAGSLINAENDHIRITTIGEDVTFGYFTPKTEAFMKVPFGGVGHEAAYILRGKTAFCFSLNKYGSLERLEKTGNHSELLAVPPPPRRVWSGVNIIEDDGFLLVVNDKKQMWCLGDGKWDEVRFEHYSPTGRWVHLKDHKFALVSLQEGDVHYWTLETQCHAHRDFATAVFTPSPNQFQLTEPDITIWGGKSKCKVHRAIMKAASGCAHFRYLMDNPLNEIELKGWEWYDLDAAVDIIYGRDTPSFSASEFGKIYKLALAAKLHAVIFHLEQRIRSNPCDFYLQALSEHAPRSIAHFWVMSRVMDTMNLKTFNENPHRYTPFIRTVG